MINFARADIVTGCRSNKFVLRPRPGLDPDIWYHNSLGVRQTWMTDLVLELSNGSIYYTQLSGSFFSPKHNALTWFHRRKDTSKVLTDEATDRINYEDISHRHAFVKSLPNLRNLEITICFTQGEGFSHIQWWEFQCMARESNYLSPLLELIGKSALGLIIPNLTFKVYSEDCRLDGQLLSSGLLLKGERHTLTALEAPPSTCEDQLLQALEALLPKPA
jgi:hypothetical protein